MAFKIYVGTTDRTAYFKRPDVTFSRVLGRRAGRLSLLLNDEAAGWIPGVGEEIIVCDEDRVHTDGVWSAVPTNPATTIRTASGVPNFTSADLGKTIAIQDGVSAANSYWLSTTIGVINSAADITVSTARPNTSAASGRTLRVEHRRYFGGIITRTTRRPITSGGKGLRVSVEASDYGILLRRDPYFTDFERTATTADVVLADILARIDYDNTPSYGVVQGTVFPTTSLSTFRIAADQTLEQILDNLTTQIGYQGYINERKALVVETAAPSASGVSFTSSNSTILDLSVDHVLDSTWANDVAARFGGSGEDWIDIDLTSYLNGVRTSWHVPYVIDGAPAYVTINGVVKPIEPLGATPPTWSWTRTSPNYGTLTQVGGSAYNTASGHTLVVRALAKFPSWLYLDPASQAIDGTTTPSPPTTTWTQHHVLDVPETRDYREVIRFLNNWVDGHNSSLTTVTLRAHNTWIDLNRTATVTHAPFGLGGGALNVVGLKATMLPDLSWSIDYTLATPGIWIDKSAEWFARLVKKA